MVYILFPLLVGSIAGLSLIELGGVVSPVYGLFVYPFVMILLPLADMVLPKLNNRNVQQTKFVHEVALALVLPLVGGLILAGLWRLGQSSFGMWEAVMMGLSVGMVSGAIGMTAAHEMIHRQSKIWRGIGVCVLVLVQYGHFRIEHIYGHHIHVGTIKDPATARKGEGFYRFFVRVLITSYLSAWQIEARRLHNRNEKRLSPHNRLLHYLGLQAMVIAVAFMMAGALGLLFIAVQTIIALILTEAVDYIQHYGLMRQTDRHGRPEPVAHHHSWNSRHAAGDWTTFNIGLHSHHHSHARTPFAELSQEEEQHEMPANYAVMIALALLPPLWFHMMDHRV
ncbi:MAG: alkane 1-monooxygenase [Candidatus Puniceispirillaceae bacterium]